MKIDITPVDYTNVQHAQDLLLILDNYAQDEMGGGKALKPDVKQNLIARLVNLPYAYSYVAYVNDVPAGLVTAFESFSTFNCKPLLNIHDLAVEKKFRGLGLSQLLLAEVEKLAIEKACCKVTLEVLEGNEVAKNAYTKYGFNAYELDPNMGSALFWEKKL